MKLIPIPTEAHPISSEDESQWNKHPHWEWRRDSPGMHILRSIEARFSLIVEHFRPEMFYWLAKKIRSLSQQKPAIIQFHDQK